MPISDLHNELWADLAFQEFLSTANIAAVTNRSFDGTAARRGDVVHVNFFDPSSLTVQSSWESGQADNDFGSGVAINIDQTPAINVKIDKLDEMYTNADLVAETTAAIGASMANHVDEQLILAVSGTAGVASAPVVSYDNLVAARKILTGNGYPVNGDVWYFASADQYESLLKDDDINRAQNSGDNNQIVSGEVRRIAGVNVVEQTVVPDLGILFHRRALAHVNPGGMFMELDSTLGGSKSFGTILGAGMLFGNKVLSANGVALITDS